MTNDQRATPHDRSRRRGKFTAAAIAAGLGLVTAPILAAASASPVAASASPIAASAEQAASATEEAAQSIGWVRAGHLSPGTPKADITLTPFSGGDPLTIRGVAFADVTDYLRVPAGLYTLAIRAEDQPDAQPMVTANVVVAEGSASTVIATGEDGPAQVQVVSDDLTPPSEGTAKVRLISAAGTDEPVTASVVDGPTLAEDVTTGSATGYAEVAAQTWDIEVAAGDTTAPAASIAVEAGGVYTLLVLGDDVDGLELQAIQDSAGTGSMPQGGVDTGAGGTAVGPTDGDALSPTWEAGAVGVAVLGAVIFFGPARRRRADVRSTG